MFRNLVPGDNKRPAVNKPFKPPRLVNATNTDKRDASNSNTSKSNGDAIKLNIDGSTTVKANTNLSSDLAERKRESFAQKVPRASTAKRPRIQRSLSVPRPQSNGDSRDELVIKESKSESNTNFDQDYATRYFMILYRKKTLKKNKTWDGDGVMVLRNSHVSLKREQATADGLTLYSNIASGSKKNLNIEDIISVGQYEAEVDYEVTKKTELQALFGRLSKGNNNSDLALEDAFTDDDSPYTKETQANQGSNGFANPNRPFKAVVKQESVLPKPYKKVESKFFTTNLTIKKQTLFAIQPDSLVMDRVPGDPDKIMDVVVDPLLSRHLRPHQREGVKFLYNSVMGINGSNINGALLADAMGLGKTLMTIALAWTLLKQSPYIEESSVAKKILIIAPVTLIGNWKKEFKKWLSMNRVGILTVGSKQNSRNDLMNIKMFGQTRVHQVLLLGYEKLVTLRDVLVQSRIKFDLLVCDEGHRLKSGSSKALQVLNSLQIKKKVLLSGTPIQNDLEEFFTLINFINPGILGSYPVFQKSYMKPILRSRDPHCYNKDILKLGSEKSEELIQLTKSFILRRTADILAKFLPPRTDLVIFAKPTKVQAKLFQELLNSKNFINFEDMSAFGDKRSFQAETLAMINLFKKVCNSPSLAQDDNMFNKVLLARIEEDFNSDLEWWTLAKRVTPSTSSKLLLLMKILSDIRSKTDEKVVVISNYTKTLDLIEQFIISHNMAFSRLDGGTPSNKRESIVTNFNKTPAESNFIFLLSSKSGGVGLNLIGASRLILFDNDWNPSIDLQAMARIHRDGQTRPTFIYRLMTTGCIDEKIFQRQLMKISLSNKFLDDQVGSKDDVFDYEDLKELFKLDLETACNTHDLIECHCDGTGEIQSTSVSRSNSYGESSFGEGSGAVDDGRDTDKDNDSDGDLELDKENKGWVSAKFVKSEQESLSSQSKNKVKIKGCLNGYQHIDPRKVGNEDLSSCGDIIMDDILFDEKAKSRITYIFTKVSL